DFCTVRHPLQKWQPRLTPPPPNQFETDLVKSVRADKTPYVRFDLNDYSIPSTLVGCPLTLAASQSTVRILDGGTEVARHRRSYDRGQCVEDPAHLAALLEEKRKALGSTAGGRLAQMVPNSRPFLEAAFQRGESVARQSVLLLALLDDYGAKDLPQALPKALKTNPPPADPVAFTLPRRSRSRKRLPLPVDLSRHPHLADIAVPTHQLEVYDDLSDDDTTD